MTRKLVSIQRIHRINPIAKADAIECVTIHGWELVAKKGEFAVGDLCCFFEIDSFLPEDPRYEFLKNLKSHQGRKGYRIKTIVLRGQVSQGLALPLSMFPEITNPIELDEVTDLLNVIKYDNSIAQSDNKPGLKAGSTAGKFPHFIPKTDQERIQNLSDWFTRYSDVEWEETLKLDGSSCTMYNIEKQPSLWQRIRGFFGLRVISNHFGVCSRNLEIKRSDNYVKTFTNSDKESTYQSSDFWRVAHLYNVERHLPTGYAIQGELIGPRIQANHEKVESLDFFIFDVYDILNSRYLTPLERANFVSTFLPTMKHVPVLNPSIRIFEVCPDIKSLLIRVQGQSMNPGTISEGRVYKSIDGTKSFKCINNDFLLKCEQ